MHEFNATHLVVISKAQSLQQVPWYCRPMATRILSWSTGKSWISIDRSINRIKQARQRHRLFALVCLFCKKSHWFDSLIFNPIRVAILLAERNGSPTCGQQHTVPAIAWMKKDRRLATTTNCPRWTRQSPSLHKISRFWTIWVRARIQRNLQMSSSFPSSSSWLRVYVACTSPKS